MPEIHPSAIVSSKAEIANDVKIGPFTIVEPDVIIGEGTQIFNNVTIKTGSRIGKKNKIYQSVVIGADPQDLKFSGEFTEVFMGDENVIREYVTISRGTSEKKKTIVGSGSLFMANTHIGHDCIIGNGCILANSVALGGHVKLEDFVRLGGLVGIHQFVKIGAYTMIGAHAMVVKDVVPYALFSGNPLTYEGLNLVGLKRSGFDDIKLDMIKKAFKLLFMSGLNVSQAIQKIKTDLPQAEEIKHLIEFTETSSRGISK